MWQPWTIFQQDQVEDEHRTNVRSENGVETYWISNEGYIAAAAVALAVVV